MANWEKTSISRKLVRFREQLVPEAVTVSSEVTTASNPFPVSVEVTYAIVRGNDPRISSEKLVADGPVSNELLGSVDFQQLGEEVYSEWLEDPSYSTGEKAITLEAPAPELAHKAKQLTRELELREVAWIYLQAPSRGTTNVVQTMKYGSRSTASLRVKEAREQGLIPKAGATKTEYAKALEALRKERSSNA